MHRAQRGRRGRRVRRISLTLAVCLGASGCPGVTGSDNPALAILDGFVRGPNDEGLGGAQVTIRAAPLTGPEGPPSTRITESDGFYRADLDPLLDERWRVSAAKEGFDCDGPKTTTLERGKASRVNFTCTPQPTGASVTVTVQGPQGPLAGAEVTLVGAPQVTGSNGQAVFSGVSAGAYSVTVVRAAFFCPPGTISIPGPGAFFLTIVCISLASPPPGTVVVTVTADGQPLGGAFVGLSGPSPGGTTTGADGVGVFTNRQPGNYGVSANLTGYQCGSTTVTLPQGGFATAAVICEAVGG
jgi:hypothetical protein